MPKNLTKLISRAVCKAACLAACLSLIALAPAAAQTADRISGPVKRLVGFPPGGTGDIIARLVAARVAASLGTTLATAGNGPAKTLPELLTGRAGSR